MRPRGEREVRFKDKNGGVKVLPEGGQRLSFNRPYDAPRPLREATWAKPADGGVWANPKYGPSGGLQRFAVTLRGRVKDAEGVYPLLGERIDLASDMDELINRFQKGPEALMNVTIKRLL